MSRIYLDSNVYIHHFDLHPYFGSSATQTLLACQKHVLLTSLFNLSEVLVGPAARADEFKSAQAKRFFNSSALMVPYTFGAALTYASLRAQQRVKPLDALHLACAASAGVDLFITNDQALLKLTVPGIGRIAALGELF